MFSSSIKGTKGTGTVLPPATNPPFKYVQALYHFDGGTFDNLTTGMGDVSPAANSVSVAPPLQAFSASSNNPFNATYSIDCRAADNPGLSWQTNGLIGPGSSAFCIEFWMFGYSYTTNTDHRCPYSLQNNDTAGRLSIWFGHPTNGLRKMHVVTAGGTVLYSSTMEIPLNVWCHIAITRNSSNSMNIYLNGVGGTPATVSTAFNITVNTQAYIGCNNTNNLPFDGLLSNLRHVNGNEVYTGNFTPPTSNLTATQSAGTNINAITGNATQLLTLQRPYNFDGSVWANGIGRGGLYPWYVPETPFANATIAAPSTPVAWSNASFGSSIGPCSVSQANTPGSTGGTYQLYVSPATANFGFGTGDFTIDMWVYVMNDSARSDFITIWTNTGQRFSLFLNPAASYELTGNLNGTINCFSGSNVFGSNMVGQWIFLAVSRNAGTMRLFYKGVQIGGSQSGFTLGSSNLLFIGNENSIIAMQACTRVIVGTGLYSGTFTIPTVPSTSTGAQTKFLLTQDAPVIDYSMKTSLIGGGNFPPYLNAGVSKFGTASAQFDGTATTYWTTFYNSSKGNSNILFGTSDFTVECWIYANSGVSDKGIFQIAFTAGGFGGQTGLALGYFTSNNLRLYYGAASAVTGTAGRLSTSSWIHVAVVRKVTWSGSTPTGALKVYINGIEDTALAVTDSYSYPTAYLTVGGYDSTTKTWNGYIDEFRISRYAVYTANFAPPTSAFPNS